jgi:SAM-dependent methyltransferase
MNSATVCADYHLLVHHYEKCFIQYGANAQGVDWPNEEDALIRHQVMQELWQKDKEQPLKIVDVGCGYGAFLAYLQQSTFKHSISYTGIDLSQPMIEYASAHYPTGKFIVQDIIKQPYEENSFDYGIMNGVLTEKLGLHYRDMEAFAQHMIKNLYKSCRTGIAFNMMSTHLDWTRVDLFHMPFDRIAAFLKAECSRHFSLRADYGLYEYTVYLYKR